MNRIKLVIGDWSRDGHEKSETFVIESNLTKKEIEKAFKKGTKLINIDFTKYCEEYEDSSIPMEVASDLFKLGFDMNSIDDYDQFSKTVCLDPTSYMMIYLFLAQKGNPNFGYTIIDENLDEIHIGGYGLFY